MLFCEKCFSDIQIKSIISSLQERGQCHVCKSKDVCLYDTDKHNLLEPIFDELLNIYTPATILEKRFPDKKIKKSLLSYELDKRWKLFSGSINVKGKETKINEIIKSICKTKYTNKEENGIFKETYTAPH